MASPASTPSVPQLIGGGEMGRRVRETDWSATALGSYEAWPQSLRSTLSLVLNASGIAAIYWGPEQRLLYNDAYGLALGDRHPWAFGRPMAEALADMAPVLGPQVAEVLRTGAGFAIENLTLVMRRHGRDEETAWTYSFSPVQGETSGFAGVLLLAIEMTGRKAAERSAEQARTRLETALRVARLGAFEWDVSTGALELNARSREIFDLPQEGQMWAADVFARIAPEHLDRVQAEIVAAMALLDATDAGGAEHSVNFSYDIVHSDGSQRSIDSSGTFLRNPDGTPRVLGSFNDVTDLRRAEARLHERNATLEQHVAERTAERNQMWETSPDLMVIIDFEGTFRRVNPAWTTVLGYSEEELVNHHVNEFVIPDDHRETTEAYELAAGGGLPRIENRYRHKDGSVRWVSWVAAPAGDMTYATGRDITAEKRQAEALAQAEEALRQAQKMEAVGQLTGGVAHDFNNLLTIIRSSVDFLRRPDLPDVRKERYLTAVSDTVDRAAKLTGQLLAFARRQVLKPEVFDVAAKLRGVADMLDTLTGSRIHVSLEVPDEPCYARADVSQFETALVNMAVNARDAMDGEGRLVLRLFADAPKPQIRLHAASKVDFVALSVTDTGTGIASDQLGRIFEPFFTTKGVGKGTGLGLSQVFGFAKQSGGDVDVDSVVGKGTTFTLYLPQEAAFPAGATDADAKGATSPGGAGQRVLVVEDNIEVGQFCTQILEDLGYVTEWAATAEEALDRLGLDGGGFDVVFSDVVMSGMGGVALAETLLERLPAMPVVLTSGYSHVLAREDDHGFEVLHKPYSAEQLGRLLQRVTSKASTSAYKVAS